MTLSEQIARDGWAKVALPCPDVVRAIGDELLAYVVLYLGGAVQRLQDVHQIVNDPMHETVQADTAKIFRARQYGRILLAAQSSLLADLLGPDILVQRDPYVRVTRPGSTTTDNIGLHRDTLYGATPYELSVWVPFVDLPPEASLSVLPGSHVLPDTAFTIERRASDVEKGSTKHGLGFPYAPQVVVLTDEQRSRLVTPAVSVGEALIFPLSLVHGSEANTSDVTRWSTDIRVTSPWTPSNAKEGYYVPLCTGGVSRAGRLFEGAA